MGVLIPKENRHVEENAGSTAERCEQLVDPPSGKQREDNGTHPCELLIAAGEGSHEKGEMCGEQWYKS